MNILITICARGGSKGIPGKNIKLLKGKPLIGYTIDVAKRFAAGMDPIGIAGVLQACGVGLEQVVQHQIVYREEHGHGQNGQGQHRIVQWRVRAAAAQQQQRKPQSDNGGGQQIDGCQRFQPGREDPQDHPGLPVKPVAQHAAVAVEEQGPGHGIAAIDEVHKQQHAGQGLDHQSIDSGRRGRGDQTRGAACRQHHSGNDGGPPGGTHQQPPVPAHEQLVEPGTAGFAAFGAAVQGELAPILSLGFLGGRIGIACQQGQVIRCEDAAV